MGDVVEIAAFDPLVAKGEPPSKPKLRPEPKGYLLVPVRVLECLARFEASIDAVTKDIPSDIGKRLDWQSYYQTIALLELATRYQ